MAVVSKVYEPLTGQHVQEALEELYTTYTDIKVCEIVPVENKDLYRIIAVYDDTTGG